ncbi:NAD(P)-dependent oxidoreductase [Bdellovibrio svalbardensis]|uniref:NAD(P)-dependent oxidoreductase n=1 Tax=Bdellovibrio svalbardensis TaxID=2972972 RepID=A0ABT6DL40_9BACT|nr:NAD(P)-dependent oxidoreductase [Bdellovibrio svalbardensis]MDG0817583.1 NAD(P)-dependent oxidoreductase [Bdellovibrio svalbardensis]
MKIGFMGLGHMGSKMAARILQAGFELSVYNRTPAAAKELVSQGAKLVESPADLHDCHIVISMLSDDKAVESVVYGDRGFLKHVEPGTIHISMSTISPSLAEHMDIDHQMVNCFLVGAPVFGRPESAEAGKLFVMAGGDEQVLRSCKRVFAALAQKVYHVGENPAHAHLMKILGNFMLVSNVQILSEALALAEKSGLNQKIFLEAMTSSLFSAPLFKNYGGMIIEKAYNKKNGFGMPLALKDIRLAQEAAANAGSPLPMASLVHDQVVTAMARGLGQMDLSALGKLAADNAGIIDQSSSLLNRDRSMDLESDIPH